MKHGDCKEHRGRGDVRARSFSPPLLRHFSVLLVFILVFLASIPSCEAGEPPAGYDAYCPDCDLSHGTCGDGDGATYNCTCDPGWGPEELCDTPQCSPVCENGGNCIPTNAAGMVCNCTLGWNGTSCGEATCTDKCIHGVCDSPNHCQCDFGWNGLTCEQNEADYKRDIKVTAGIMTGASLLLVFVLGTASLSSIMTGAASKGAVCIWMMVEYLQFVATTGQVGGNLPFGYTNYTSIFGWTLLQIELPFGLTEFLFPSNDDSLEEEYAHSAGDHDGDMTSFVHGAGKHVRSLLSMDKYLEETSLTDDNLLPCNLVYFFVAIFLFTGLVSLLSWYAFRFSVWARLPTQRERILTIVTRSLWHTTVQMCFVGYYGLSMSAFIVLTAWPSGGSNDFYLLLFAAVAVMVLLVTGLPVFNVVVLGRNNHTPKYNVKYGIFLSCFRNENLCQLMGVALLLRKLVCALVIVTMQDYQYQQVLILVIMHTLWLFTIYMLNVYEDAWVMTFVAYVNIVYIYRLALLLLLLGVPQFENELFYPSIVCDVTVIVAGACASVYENRTLWRELERNFTRSSQNYETLDDTRSEDGVMG